MRNNILALLASFFLISYPLSVQAVENKEYLISFSAGELTSPKLLEDADMSISDKYVCKTELTKENAEKGKKLLKVTLTKGKGKFGVTNPEKEDWSKWDSLKFKVFNPQDFTIRMNFVAREKDRGYGPAGSGPDNDWASRSDSSVMIKSGWNDLTLDLTTFATNGAKENFNMKRILEWSFCGGSDEAPAIFLFFSDLEFSNE
ncbi:MAG: hypothetical protein A2231_07905 [Candidatus Firestonebacteria bacterium RIFOXYA2_FULL_40_8]|nr:MAG: hypothetical protein A2231_07905 [Candidatus Firestonebacteria bacterium RIFOXYA2_FULL_40_8]